MANHTTCTASEQREWKQHTARDGLHGRRPAGSRKVHLSGSGGTENRAVHISQGQPKHANSTPAFCVLSNRRSYLMGSWVKNSGPWEDRGTLASQGKQEVWMDGKGGTKTLDPLAPGSGERQAHLLLLSILNHLASTAS